MEAVPLSQLLVFSKKTNPFNTVEWLKSLEEKDLERIIEASEMFFEINEDYDEEEIPFEALDYLTLCYMLGEKELNDDSGNFTEDTKINCLMGLESFARCEKMRRCEFLDFTGSGLVSDFSHDDTDIVLTTKGSMLASSMKTIRDISQAIQNDS